MSERTPYLGRYDAKPASTGSEPAPFVAAKYAPDVRFEMDPDQRYGSEAEAAFVETILNRGFPAPTRSGWPDFLVFDKQGKAFGVEVKRGKDRVSIRQARCFIALGRVGLKVYIWDPKCPTRLVDWRNHIKSHGVSGGAQAEAKAMGLDIPVEDPEKALERKRRWAQHNEASGLKAARLARKAEKAKAAGST